MPLRRCFQPKENEFVPAEAARNAAYNVCIASVGDPTLERIVPMRLSVLGQVPTLIDHASRPHMSAAAGRANAGNVGRRCRIGFVSVRHDACPKPIFPAVIISSTEQSSMENL